MLNQPESEQDHKNIIEQGFTLVELLIVIVILGILAGIGVFAVGNLTSGSAQKACQTEAATFATAYQAYKASSAYGNGTGPAPQSSPAVASDTQSQANTMKSASPPLLSFGTKLKYLDGAAGGNQASGKGWTSDGAGNVTDTNCSTAVG